MMKNTNDIIDPVLIKNKYAIFSTNKKDVIFLCIYLATAFMNDPEKESFRSEKIAHPQHSGC